MSIPYLVNGETLALTAHRVTVASMEMDAMLTSQRLIFLRNAPAGSDPLIIPLWCFISVAGTRGYTGEPGICITFSCDTTENPVQFDLLFHDSVEKSRQRERDQWLKAFMEGIVAARQKQVLTDIGNDIPADGRSPDGICLALPDNFIEILRRYPRAAPQVRDLYSGDNPDDASWIPQTEAAYDYKGATDNTPRESPVTISVPKGRPCGISEMCPLHTPYEDDGASAYIHQEEIYPGTLPGTIGPDPQESLGGNAQDLSAETKGDSPELPVPEISEERDVHSYEHDEDVDVSVTTFEEMQTGNTGVTGVTALSPETLQGNVLLGDKSCRDNSISETPPVPSLPETPLLQEEPGKHEPESISSGVAESAPPAVSIASILEEPQPLREPDAGREDTPLSKDETSGTPVRDDAWMPAFRPVLMKGAIALGVVALVMAALAIGGMVIQGTDMSRQAAAVPVQNVTPHETIAPTFLPEVPAVPRTGVWIRVTCPNLYYGSIGSPGSLHEVAGTGDNTYEVKVDTRIVQASLQKRDSSGDPLTLFLYRNGSLIAERSTRIPQGSVDFLLDIATGQPPGIDHLETQQIPRAGQSYMIENL